MENIPVKQPSHCNKNTIVVSGENFLKMWLNQQVVIGFDVSHLIGKRVKIISSVSRRFIYMTLYSVLDNYSYWVK